ncbi:hypothetical protein C8F01DRAFT_1206765 [Mycena amicta]|nr:hypothetical protein C8F01DRAFT_1206765 [Mycena amicta]
METTLGASTTQSRDVNVEVQSSSWWEYVGWSSAPQSTQPRPQDKQEEQGESTPKPAVQQISEESEPPAAASIDELGPVRNDEVAAPVSNEQSSSWYSPWAWYGLAPSDPNPASSNEEKTPEAPSPPLDLAEAASEPSPPSPFVPDSRTAAQQRYWTSFFSASYSQPPLSSNPAVETGADAPEITVESTPPPVPKTSSSVALPNPIADSMTSQSASWVSFFNTGTLGYISRKTVASGEPEVMEIDVDEVPAEQEVSKTPPAIVVPTAPPSTGTKPEAKPAKLAKEELEGKPMKEGPSPSKAIKDETPARPTKTAKPSSKPSAPPLTISDSVKRQHLQATSRQSKPASIAPPRTPPANLVLPTWADTFHTAPRSVVPQRFIDAQGRTVGRAMEKTMKFVSSVLFASDGSSSRKRRSSIAKGKAHGSGEFEDWGLGLPRAWDGVRRMYKEGNFEDVLRGCRNVCVIGIHGWFPGAVMRSVLGEFVNMMVTALEDFQEEYNVRLEKISKIPLEGEGTIDRRVEKLYATLTSNTEWMDDLHAADVIFVATHSQGSIVSTHILNRLINEGHIQTGGYDSAKPPSSPSAGTYAPPPAPRQRVCCLALCGIHLGPLRYLNSSSLLLPYIQYFESAAAKELFEFQDTESEVSRALSRFIPESSPAASHNLILRALVHGRPYHSSDFLSNLLVLLIRVLNAGLTERGLVTHLSEATAGSLNGVGHSTAYEEIGNYTCAVKYLFLTNGGFETHPKLSVEPFNASTEQNDYEIPWSLRDMIADPQVAHFFSKEISQLAADFRHWSPKTTILRDVKRKLQPIQRLPSSFSQPKL